MGPILGFIISLLVAAVVIFIVSKLNLGLNVTGFVAAIIAALVIAIVSSVVLWLLGLLGISLSGGWFGLLITLVVSAVVLMISDKFVPGMTVKGFKGAIIAAIAISVVYWILGLIAGIFA